MARQSVEGKGLFKPQKFTLKSGTKIDSRFPASTYVIITIILLILISAYITEFSIVKLIERGNEFFTIPLQMFPPDLSYIETVIPPLLETIQMSLIGSFIGCVLALPVAFLASSNINHNKIILKITRSILTLFRTLPVLIYATIFTYIFGFGAFAGTLAIIIFTFAVVSKMLYDNIETIELGPYEALLSAGSTKPRAIVTAVFPQVLPHFFSTSLYSLEMNIRSSAILGYVGAGGIGVLIDFTLNWTLYAKFGTIFVCLFIVVIAVESLSRYLRGRLS